MTISITITGSAHPRALMGGGRSSAMDSAIRRGFVTILAGFLLGGAALPAFAGYPLAPANCASLNGGQGTQDGRVVLGGGGTVNIPRGPRRGSGAAGENHG